jgi:hypothetical protein
MNARMSVGSNIFVGEWLFALSDTSLSTERALPVPGVDCSKFQEQIYDDTGADYTFRSEWKCSLRHVVLMVRCDRSYQDPSWCF